MNVFADIYEGLRKAVIRKHGRRSYHADWRPAPLLKTAAALCLQFRSQHMKRAIESCAMSPNDSLPRRGQHNRRDNDRLSIDRDEPPRHG